MRNLKLKVEVLHWLSRECLWGRARPLPGEPHLWLALVDCKIDIQQKTKTRKLTLKNVKQRWQYWIARDWDCTIFQPMVVSSAILAPFFFLLRPRFFLDWTGLGSGEFLRKVRAFVFPAFVNFSEIRSHSQFCIDAHSNSKLF